MKMAKMKTEVGVAIKKVEFLVLEEGEPTVVCNKGILFCESDETFIARFTNLDRRLMFTATFTLLDQLKQLGLLEEYREWLIDFLGEDENNG